MDSQAILTPTDEAHVFLVEGAHLNHNSIAGLLRLAGLTVHTWPTTTRFLESIPKAAPAALVVNLGNHVSDGLALHAELISRGIRLPVVFLTKPDRAREAVQAVKQGVFDVLFEPTSREELLQAVPEALEKDLNQIRVLARQSRLSAKNSLLSPRESQVHKMMLKGFGNREIAEALAISVATAKQYKSAVMRKSGVRTLAELFEASATLDTSSRSPIPSFAGYVAWAKNRILARTTEPGRATFFWPHPPAGHTARGRLPACVPCCATSQPGVNFLRRSQCVTD